MMGVARKIYVEGASIPVSKHPDAKLSNAVG
jgi:hypothetical protein